MYPMKRFAKRLINRSRVVDVADYHSEHLYKKPQCALGFSGRFENLIKKVNNLNRLTSDARLTRMEMSIEHAQCVMYFIEIVVEIVAC